MKGPEFVKVLKDLGFENVKTHMAVIDDADQMVLEVRLTAAGYEKAVSESVSSGSPIKKKSPIRKKAIQKKSSSTPETTATVTAEPESPPPSSTPPLIRRKTTAPASDETTDQETASTTDAATADTDSATPETDEVVAESTTTAAAATETREATRDDSPTATDTPSTDTSGGDEPSTETESDDPTPERDTLETTTTPPEVEPPIERTPEPPTETAAERPEREVEPTPEPAAPERSPERVPEKPSEPASEPKRPAASTPLERKEAAPSREADPQPAAPAASGAESTAAAGKTEADATAGTTGDAPASGSEPAKETQDGKVIRRLPQPERRAKILGRIELPQETISDASRRSAPSGPRNPASVDRNLRQAAMQQFRNRGAKGSLPARRGPPMGRGPGQRGSGGGGRSRQKQDPLAPPPGVDPDKLVQIEAPVSVKKLSEGLGHKVNHMLLVLMKLGVKANINSYLDKDQVELIALELSRNVEVVEERGAEDELISHLAEAKEELTDDDRTARPPVVTFMGHVDHGKTTLLDALRGSDITKGEAGGITQHVGAYRIERAGHAIVVLDTPGHAAFTQMRARGAQLTDVVVLVVAADDGVMPQTEEALNHAKAAEVPLLIAVNKCDKPDANPMRARQQLSTMGVQPEEWGGNVQFVDISALTGDGLDDLVEKIALEAEILELQAAPDHAASGIVIEAKQTPAQGNVISLIVMDGTLRKGDLVLCGSGTGRIRVLLDDHGRQIDEAPPGTPAEVLGLPELPNPGDKFFVVTDTKMAKEVAEQRATKQRSMDIAEKSKARMMDLKSQLAAQKKEEVRLIIKADVMGSLEPIRHSLEELSNDEVQVRILHSALGGVTETDVALADASNAIIVGFNSVPDDKARAKADEAAVTIRFYNIIYELIDDVRKLLEGLLAPERREEIRGHATIRRVFKSSKFGNISGCFVTDGVIGRNHQARLIRDGIVVYSGKIGSLRREKDDAREVKTNFECGILLHNYDDVKEGDIIQTYEIVELQRTLGDS